MWWASFNYDRIEFFCSHKISCISKVGSTGQKVTSSNFNGDYFLSWYTKSSFLALLTSFVLINGFSICSLNAPSVFVPCQFSLLFTSCDIKAPCVLLHPWLQRGRVSSSLTRENSTSSFLPFMSCDDFVLLDTFGPFLGSLHLERQY